MKPEVSKLPRADALPRPKNGKLKKLYPNDMFERTTKSWIKNNEESNRKESNEGKLKHESESISWKRRTNNNNKEKEKGKEIEKIEKILKGKIIKRDVRRNQEQNERRKK